MGLAFLYEYYVGGFTDERQAEVILRHRIAAVIPKMKRSPEGGSPADQILDAPLSLFAEAIRRVRVGFDQALNIAADSEQSIVLMVTSAVPAEGKSTVALALARSYSEAGKRTLLIDGDLRKPSLHRLINQQPKFGLLDFLKSNDKSLNYEVVHTDPKSEAVLLLGARRSDVATDQIVSAKLFGGLIDLARTSFDVIIIDTSPLVPVVDGLHIARLVDAALFVVRWAGTGQQDARKALETLETVMGDKPIVLSLNQQEVSNSSYVQRYGGYYTEASG